MIALPTLRAGIRRDLGRFMDAGLRNGLEMSVRGPMVVIDIWREGEKFYTIEVPPERAEQMAELLHQGAQHIRRAGGSAVVSSGAARAVQPRA